MAISPQGQVGDAYVSARFGFSYIGASFAGGGVETPSWSRMFEGYFGVFGDRHIEVMLSRLFDARSLEIGLHLLAFKAGWLLNPLWPYEKDCYGDPTETCGVKPLAWQEPLDIKMERSNTEL